VTRFEVGDRVRAPLRAFRGQGTVLRTNSIYKPVCETHGLSCPDTDATAHSVHFDEHAYGSETDAHSVRVCDLELITRRPVPEISTTVTWEILSRYEDEAEWQDDYTKNTKDEALDLLATLRHESAARGDDVEYKLVRRTFVTATLDEEVGE